MGNTIKKILAKDSATLSADEYSLDMIELAPARTTPSINSSAKNDGTSIANTLNPISVL